MNHPFGLRSALNTLFNVPSSRAARLCNFILISVITISSIVSMCSTMKGLSPLQCQLLCDAEYVFALIFSFEYLMRLYAAPSRWNYIFSAYGIIDLLAIIPVFILGMQDNSLVLRTLRILSILRLIKIIRYWGDLMILILALKESARLLTFVVGGVIVLATIGGNLMYYVEPENFETAFDGVWWTLVTMSTVGYGDFVPHTGAGKFLASIGMFIGIGIFAIITAIIGSKIQMVTSDKHARCTNCHDVIPMISQFCLHCGQPQPVMIIEPVNDDSACR